MFLGRTGFGSFVPQRHLKRLVVSVGLFGAAAPARPGTRERNGLSPDRVPC